MKKKIFISFLTLVLFVSTTSLPVTIHLCKMAQTTKTCSCGMMKHCKMACKNNTIKNFNKLSLKSNCCSTKTVDTSLKDEYLTQKNNGNDNFQTSVVILINNPFENIEQFNINKKYFHNFSPPLLTTNNLYLNNSVLLI
jgi:hypothetical protein